MLGYLEVDNLTTIVTDHEEAVEHAEPEGWNGEESIPAMASRWLRRKARQLLAGFGSLGARFIQRETVRSEIWKLSMSSSP